MRKFFEKLIHCGEKKDLQEVPDREWDEKLGIITAGAEGDSSDLVNFRYEPTPYAVLERLAQSGLLGPDSLLIDYGCGRGRCSLFLHVRTGCRAIGIDHNPVLVGEAKANLERMRDKKQSSGKVVTDLSIKTANPGEEPLSGTEYPDAGRGVAEEHFSGTEYAGAGKGVAEDVTFRRAKAQNYRVTDENAFYFFNPFSEVILQGVLQEIIGSWYENPRQIYLFFYYPKDEDVALLSMYDEIMFYDEIDCTDLYDGKDAREKILVFELAGRK